MQNCNVVFDTNSYRNLVTGFLEEEVRIKFKNIRELERKKNINAYVIPVVLLELLAHVADINDPAYDHCKKALIASCIHCHNLENKPPLNYYVDFDIRICNLFFIKNPYVLIENIHNIICLSLIVEKNSDENRLEKYRKSIIAFRELSEKLKNDFIKINTVVKDEYPIKNFEKELKENKVVRGLAYTQLKRICNYYEQNIDNLPEKEMWIDRIIIEFPVPFIFYQNYLEKFFRHPEYNVEKKGEGNNYFDFNILYIIGKGDIFFVTDENKIIYASKEAGLENKVLNLKTYLEILGIN